MQITTKRQAVQIAANHDIAVYRSDTMATIVARIEAHLRRMQELANERSAETSRFNRALAAYSNRRACRVRIQLALPMFAPRDWSVAAGKIAA